MRGEADGYLERLGRQLRAVASEVWHSEQARQGAEFGLLFAREMYVSERDGTFVARRPEEALAEALGPGFARPVHAPGCRGHKHGRNGCLERSCPCALAVTARAGFPPRPEGEG